MPWSGFDLFNAFNAWKRSAHAGRRFVVDTAGVTGVQVTGLAWRGEVLTQVLEEAAVDLGRALKAWTDPVSRARHPRFKEEAGHRVIPGTEQDDTGSPVGPRGRGASPLGDGGEDRDAAGP